MAIFQDRILGYFERFLTTYNHAHRILLKKLYTVQDDVSEFRNPTSGSVSSGFLH